MQVSIYLLQNLNFISSTILSCLVSSNDTSFKISRLLALNTPVLLELQPGLEDQNGICINPDDKQDNIGIELSSESVSRNVEEEIQSCGRLIELIDAQFNGVEDSQCKETDIYTEQERAVLETFRDCLQKFIEIGFTRG